MSLSMKSVHLGQRSAFCRAPSTKSSRKSYVQPVQAFMTKHNSSKMAASVSKFYEDLSSKNLIDLETLLCKDVVFSDRVWSDHDLKGLPKLGSHLKEFLEAHPDAKYHTDSVISRDDCNTVAVHWTARLTCKNEYHGIPPTGVRSIMSGMTLFVFNDEEKIHEILVYRQPTQEERALYLGLEGM